MSEPGDVTRSTRVPNADRDGARGPADRLAPGRVVDGKFVVGALLGAGGMGEVYRARQLTLDRDVVLKVLHADPPPDSMRRFEREARALARLNHPHVVTVHDLGVSDEIGHYLVMEYVEGRTLREKVRRGALPVDEAIELMRQVCAGTAAAHAAGVIHRDLKPENVLLEGDGERVTAKVADFGIARLAEPGTETRDGLTGTGAVMGTANYMSPEQSRGEEADERSDVYALGCVLYELVTGRPPFEADSVLAVLEKHRTEAAPGLRDVRPDVSDALAGVAERALEKSRERRWQSAAELGDALAGVARGDAAPIPLPSTSAADTRSAAPPPPTNVTHPLTRCIGRERETEELAALLARESVRLVTITGTGGIGKTRLAVETAHGVAASFPDGVFQVDLAPLSDPALVAQQIAHVFGVKESAGSPVDERLGRHLEDKRLLVVLDNFEHLLDAAPLVARLLEAAPRVKALVTSQAPLHVRGEHEYALDALEVPALAASPEALERSPAVVLFGERARDVKPSFAVTAENAATVTEICRRLDGLPLAIELAAARVKLLSPDAILSRLERRLALLTGGARDLPERQRTMRAAVTWSYELLDAPEKALLRGLAVFTGGCTLGAAEAICGAGADVLDALGSLVEKNLVRRRDAKDGESRFEMSEVVRELALERLAAEGEAEAARLRHARYFFDIVLESQRGHRFDDASYVASLALDHENLSSAYATLLEHEPRDAVRMPIALGAYWTLRSLFSEAIEWGERALASGGAGPLDRAWLLAIMGGSEALLGDHESAGERLREAIDASRALGDASVLLVALHWGAVNLLTQPGSVAVPRAYLEEALALARSIGDSEKAASFCINLAVVAFMDGERERAREYNEEALALSSRATVKATCLLNLADFSLEDGNLGAATERAREALVMVSEFGDRARIAAALETLASISRAGGAPEKAVRLAGAADAVRESTGGVRLNVGPEGSGAELAKIRSALAPAEFEREWARGREMGLDAAVAEALRDD